MHTFKLDIITPQRKVFSETVSSISVPTADGIVGVFALHEPLFSALSEGEIKVTSEEKEYFLAIGGGFMEVTREGVSILVSRAAHAYELNEEEIKKAEQAARDAIKNHVKGFELKQAQAILRRSSLEMKVFHRKHMRPIDSYPVN